MGWVKEATKARTSDSGYSDDMSNVDLVHHQNFDRPMYIEHEMPIHHLTQLPTTPNSPIPIRTLILLLLLTLPFSASPFDCYAGCVYIICGGL